MHTCTDREQPNDFFSTKDTDLELCQTLKTVTTSLCFLKDADISPFFTLQPYTCTCIRTKPTEACTVYVCNVGLGARVCLNSHSAVLKLLLVVTCYMCKSLLSGEYQGSPTQLQCFQNKIQATLIACDMKAIGKQWSGSAYYFIRLYMYFGIAVSHHLATCMFRGSHLSEEADWRVFGDWCMAIASAM